MERVRCRNKIKPPEGWEEISELILDLNKKMREIENLKNDSKYSQEQIWEVMKLNWKRSRPVYEMKWKKKNISNELYEWILNQGFADRELINAWRIPGYDRLCCVSCISKDTNHGGTCICRVPKNQRQQNVKCFHCGCTGCCSGDFYEEKENKN